MSDTFVLDASALLAAMIGEEGAARVAEVLPVAVIGAVNIAEVVAKLQERGVPNGEITQSLNELDLTVVAFDADQAIVSGLMRSATRSAGLSLGDRCCLALAMSRGAVALTTDRSWKALEVGAQVELIR